MEKEKNEISLHFPRKRAISSLRERQLSKENLLVGRKRALSSFFGGKKEINPPLRMKS